MKSRIAALSLAAASIVFAAAQPQDPSTAAHHGTDLAAAGHCEQALPLLLKSLSKLTDKDLKRTAAFAGVKCAMALNSMDSALDFIRTLNRDFPRDTEVLYVTTHVFSDLSMRASQTLLYTAPSSYQVHELNAEALETQERWQDAASEYREVLKQNPRLSGIHYRLGRLILSAPKTPATIEDARREFKAELEINPDNPGAEYILGELARQDQNYTEAILHFGKAAKLDAGFADAFIGYGRSLIAANKAGEAIAPLETAVKLQPQNPAAHFQLATAYQHTGRKQEAQQQFALHKQTSERANQMAKELGTGIVGPQKAEP
ncbi:MAG: tetratricopeptide repeat protein [Bryobacteraceae bacterium]